MSAAGRTTVFGANKARYYDYLAGGSRALGPDRALAEAVEAAYPPRAEGLPSWPRELAARNRLFLERAVRDAVHGGVRQVLDLGCGYPVSPSLPEIALRASASARACCVDRDPSVVSAGRAQFLGVPQVSYACADLTRPGTVMADEDVARVTDPRHPVVAVFGLVLHFMEAADARRVVAGYLDLLAPGSRIVITAPAWHDRRVWEKVQAAYAPEWVYSHGELQFAALFRGCDLLGNGVEVARGWGPECVDTTAPAAILAGVGRKA